MTDDYYRLAGGGAGGGGGGLNAHKEYAAYHKFAFFPNDPQGLYSDPEKWAQFLIKYADDEDNPQ